jgi:mannitol-specific phosphotransferase system IIBC component
MAAFAFMGFESLLSNYQIGYIGIVLTLLELVLTKPRSAGVVSNLTFLTI